MQVRAWSWGAPQPQWALQPLQEACCGWRRRCCPPGPPSFPAPCCSWNLLVVQPQAGAIPKQILPMDQLPMGPSPSLQSTKWMSGQKGDGATLRGFCPKSIPLNLTPRGQHLYCHMLLDLFLSLTLWGKRGKLLLLQFEHSWCQKPL